MKFTYHPVNDWPPLSWLAISRRGDESIDVFHGGGIEVTEEWFCEAVWDGPFDEGGFDRTGIVFGSGARLRHNAVCFVSSMATVDRLHVVRGPEATFISNSLPCILRASGTIPLKPDEGFVKFFRSIERGIDDYQREIRVAPRLQTQSSYEDQTLQLVYSRNLLLSSEGLRELPKPADKVSFRTYDDYKHYMTERVVGIGENLRSNARSYPFEWLGTLSRGFDSPTCAALAKRAGLKQAVTYNEGRPGIADDALEIGEHLGINTTLHDRLAWMDVNPCEALFISADGQGKEISLASLGESLRRTVLLTGHGGGYLWRANNRSPSSRLQRGAYSGLSITEFRLHSGFIHLPLPFIGMDREADILRISLSDEMLKWRSPGEYDQPICARILDEEGVPRELFGQSKTGLSIRFVIGQDRWSSEGKRQYAEWLWRSAHRFSRRTSRIATIRCLQLGIDLINRLPRGRSEALQQSLKRVRGFLARRLRDMGSEDLAFEWAIRSATDTYSRVGNTE